MHLEHNTIRSVLVTEVLEPRVDAKSGSELLREVCRVIDGGRRQIVLDLSKVAFIDSTGLGTLVASLKHMGKSGQLVLCGVSGSPSTLFRLTRMDRVFRIYPDRDAAITAIEGVAA
jgi:anti-sigma B factor antagonist